eukprot:gene2940-3753_t
MLVPAAAVAGTSPTAQWQELAACRRVAVSSAAKPALRVAISTGDVSGDMHAARVVTALFERAEELGVRLEVVALAGERTAAAGATLIGDNTGLSSIGLLEAVPFVIPSLKLQ